MLCFDAAVAIDDLKVSSQRKLAKHVHRREPRRPELGVAPRRGQIDRGADGVHAPRAVRELRDRRRERRRRRRRARGALADRRRVAVDAAEHAVDEAEAHERAVVERVHEARRRARGVEEHVADGPRVRERGEEPQDLDGAPRRPGILRRGPARRVGRAEPRRGPEGCVLSLARA